jgi:hypothetical protein
MSSDRFGKVKVDHSQLLEARHKAPPPVLVTGMHNSGTTILTEIIHKGGIFMENSMDHYESYFFSEFINDSIIMGGEGRWAELPVMTTEEVLSFQNDVGIFIKENWIVSYLMNGYDGKSKWGFKDPRLCILLPLYLRIFPDTKVVYIDRRTEDVAASLCQKGKKGVGKLDNINYWIELTKKYKKRASSYITRRSRSHRVEYSELCKNTSEVVSGLFNFLDIEVSEQAKNVCNKVHSRRLNSYDNYTRNRENSLYSYIASFKRAFEN